MGRQVELTIEDARWQGAGLKLLARRAVKATLAELGLRQANARHKVSILGCGDARISGLNAQFRGKPVPTNVLSWPACNLSGEADGIEPDLPAPGTPLGDVAIAFETCTREATEQGKIFADHVTHLIVHATLHLIGYDHQRKRDAALMEGLEVKILASLGLSDPYH